jgi:hypothetical protein
MRCTLMTPQGIFCYEMHLEHNCEVVVVSDNNQCDNHEEFQIEMSSSSSCVDSSIDKDLKFTDVQLKENKPVDEAFKPLRLIRISKDGAHCISKNHFGFEKLHVFDIDKSTYEGDTVIAFKPQRQHISSVHHESPYPGHNQTSKCHFTFQIGNKTNKASPPDRTANATKSAPESLDVPSESAAFVVIDVDFINQVSEVEISTIHIALLHDPTSKLKPEY